MFRGLVALQTEIRRRRRRAARENAETKRKRSRRAAQLRGSWKPVPSCPISTTSRRRCAPIHPTPRTLTRTRAASDARYRSRGKTRLRRNLCLPYQMHSLRSALAAHCRGFATEISACGPARNIRHVLRTDSRAPDRGGGNGRNRDRRGIPDGGRRAGNGPKLGTTDIPPTLCAVCAAAAGHVRVQLTRRAGNMRGSQRGTAQLRDVNGGLNGRRQVAGYDLATR